MSRFERGGEGSNPSEATIIRIYKKMMYVILTLAVEFILFIIWIFYRAIKEVKEEENEGRMYPPDFFDR